MAFEINKKFEAIYAVVDLHAGARVVKELDRQLNLNEAVMRTKVCVQSFDSRSGERPTPDLGQAVHHFHFVTYSCRSTSWLERPSSRSS